MRLVSFLTLVASLAGCGEDVTLVATDTVGNAGGVIQVDELGLTITIPAGALMSDTDITVSRTSSASPEGAVTSVIRLEPEGITFAEPVELSFALPVSDLTAAYPETLSIQTSQGGAWTEAGTEVADYEDSTWRVRAYTEHFSDWVVVDTGFNGRLWGLDGADVMNFVAAGEGGFVRGTQGSTTVESTVNETHFDYYSNGATEYAVGIDASRSPQLIARTAGGAWQTVSVPGPSMPLRSIHGNGSLIIAVGFGGRIISWMNGEWQDETVAGSGHLYDVQVFGDGEAIAVGSGPTVMRRDATGTWQDDPVSATLTDRLTLRGVWGASASDHYAVGWRDGRDGVVLHRTPSGWSQERTETRRRVWSTAGSSAQTYFVGENGLLLRRDASGDYTADNLVSTSCAATASSLSLYDVLVDNSDQFVAVGSLGVVATSSTCTMSMLMPTTPPEVDAGAPMSMGTLPSTCADAGSRCVTAPLADEEFYFRGSAELNPVTRKYGAVTGEGTNGLRCTFYPDDDQSFSCDINVPGVTLSNFQGAGITYSNDGYVLVELGSPFTFDFQQNGVTVSVGLNVTATLIEVWVVDSAWSAL